MLRRELISFPSQLLLRLTTSARRGEFDIVARSLVFRHAFVVDSKISDLFFFIIFVLSTRARILTVFPFHVATLEAGLACAVLEDNNKIVSCVEEDAVAPSAPSHQQHASKNLKTVARSQAARRTMRRKQPRQKLEDVGNAAGLHVGELSTP